MQRRYVIVLGGLLITGSAGTQSITDQPRAGIVHGREGRSVITYDCEAAIGKQMRCRFTEVGVWTIEYPDGGQSETCDVAVHSYKQSFSRVTAQGQTDWTTLNPAAPHCGFSKQASFERIERSGGSQQSWKYTARYVVSDPHETTSFNAPRCSELPQKQYVFVPLADQAPVPQTCQSVHFVADCSSPDFPCLSLPPRIVH
jgi:hypothetical protein